MCCRRFGHKKHRFEFLAKALAQQSGKPAEWHDWHEELAGARAIAIFERLASNLRIGEARSATILISIDQFEEIFTIADATERTALLSLLSDVLAPARGLPFLAVATGRTDVLHGLIEKSPLATLVETTFLPPVPLERVPFLVEGPARVAGLRVEKGLTDAIVRDVESADALPLLAYTLRKLSELCPDGRLTLSAYRSLGDGKLNPVQNAIRLGADEAIAAVKPS